MSNLNQSKEDLDAVLHWRGKHAQAIRERDALQQRLNDADQALDDAGPALRGRDNLQQLVALISDPAYAATFQSIGQYRAALLKAAGLNGAPA